MGVHINLIIKNPINKTYTNIIVIIKNYHDKKSKMSLKKKKKKPHLPHNQKPNI